VLSVPVALEYEDALLRHTTQLGLTAADVEAVVDYLCKVSLHQPVFFLWRPLLPDPKDDMVLEAAIAGSCDCIVTFNVRDFAAASQFKVRVLTPHQFLSHIGALP
jgi:predicted nucleic acid-binding protein